MYLFLCFRLDLTNWEFSWKYVLSYKTLWIEREMLDVPRYRLNQIMTVQHLVLWSNLKWFYWMKQIVRFADLKKKKLPLKFKWLYLKYNRGPLNAFIRNAMQFTLVIDQHGLDHNFEKRFENVSIQFLLKRSKILPCIQTFAGCSLHWYWHYL